MGNSMKRPTRLCFVSDMQHSDANKIYEKIQIARKKKFRLGIQIGDIGYSPAGGGLAGEFFKKKAAFQKAKAVGNVPADLKEMENMRDPGQYIRKYGDQNLTIKEIIETTAERAKKLKKLGITDVVPGNVEQAVSKEVNINDAIRHGGPHYSLIPRIKQVGNAVVVLWPSGYKPNGKELMAIKVELAEKRKGKQQVIFATHENVMLGPHGIGKTSTMKVREKELRFPIPKLAEDAKELRKITRELDVDTIVYGHMHDELIGKQIGTIPKEQATIPIFTKDRFGKRKVVNVLYLPIGQVALMDVEKGKTKFEIM